MDRFIKFAINSAAVGGLLLAAGAGLQAAVGGEMSAAAPTTGFAIAAALRLIGTIALVIGVTGIYLQASDRAGRLGLIGYTLAVANLVLQAGVMWADLFLSSAVAHEAPGILDGAVSDTRMAAGFLATWIFNVSFAVLGIAILRSRVYRRLVGWAFIAIGVITLLPLPFDGMYYEVIIGLAAATAGFAARRNGTDIGVPQGTRAEPSASVALHAHDPGL